MAEVKMQIAVLLLCLWELHSGVAVQTGEPRVTERIDPLLKGVIGQTVRFRCPVESEPKAFFTWYKDGSEINDHSVMYERYKLQDQSLRLTDVQKTDAGHYMCKAVNGFGSVHVNITFVVTDGLESIGDLDDNYNPPPLDVNNVPGSPQLSHRPPSPESYPAGGTAKLRCAARGNPEPEVTWYKNGRMITDFNPETREKGKWTLTLRALRVEDSGDYACSVRNVHGSVNASFVVEVVEMTSQMSYKAKFLGSHPKNTTVDYGRTATLQCRLKSPGGLTIKITWVKVESDSHVDLSNLNTTDASRFKSIEADEKKDVDGSYLNKLVIPYATQDDVGMYLCLGVNDAGLSVRGAYLTVLPPDGSVAGGGLEADPSLSLVIIIAILVVVIIVVVVSVFVCRSSRNRSPPAPPPIQREQRQLQINKEQQTKLMPPAVPVSSSSSQGYHGGNSCNGSVTQPHLHRHHHHHSPHYDYNYA